MDHPAASQPVDVPASDRSSPETAEPPAKLSPELDALLAPLRELDLGESAVANAFDPNWGAQA